MWDASPAADNVTSYQVCIGTSTLSCNVALASVDETQTSYPITPTGGTRHYVAIRAVNSAGASAYSSEVNFSIPGLTQPSNQSNPVGTAITPLDITATDPDGGSLTFTHTGLPPGLTMNSTTGRISGTPSAAGSYNVTVFVADNLASVSRSFTWTVTNGASDTAAPTLAITSHSSGQTVTSASVTIAGTATDSGRGGSGITMVRVNGATAGNGSASGSTTANWSQPVTLVSGANTITVEAFDGAGNQSMQQITLTATLPVAPVTGATILANLISPQNAGTSVTFTAAGSGGVAPRQYKFLVAQGAGGAQAVQGWSTTATYTWTPTTAGAYTVSVWVRSAGVTADVAQASAQMAYTVNTPPVTPVASATIQASLASPRNANTPITFTAAASGGVGPRQFKFRIAQGGGAAQTVQDWSTATTYTWTPTTAATYTISVWARSAGVTTDAAQASAQMPFVISAPAPAVTVMPATPSSGSGSTQTFSLQYVDSVSANNVATAWVYFAANFSNNAANSCMAYYSRPNATLYLLDDSGTQWTPGTLGSTATLQNSQCRVALASSSVSLSGPTLTLNLAMTFSSAFAGAKHVHLYGANAAGANSGWQDRGDWTVTGGAPPPSPGVVSAIAVTPSSGTGLSQTFAFQYGDSTAASQLAKSWVWFNATFGSSANSCMLYYDRRNATLYFLNDAGTAWIEGTLGSSAVLQNAQCAVALASSSVSVSGTTLTMNLAMTFKAGYAGAKNVYLYADNTAGVNSGWHDRGDWTVPSSTPTPPTPPPAPPAAVSAVSATPSSGSGAEQMFSLAFADPSGAANLTTAWVWFTDVFGGDAGRSCMAYYDRRVNTLYLLSNDGTQWIPGALGSGDVLANRQCSITLNSSSVSISGTNMTLNLAVTFKIFPGSKSIYLYAANAGGSNSGWQNRGSWIVP
jgi:hypothetical protein